MKQNKSTKTTTPSRAEQRARELMLLPAAARRYVALTETGICPSCGLELAPAERFETTVCNHARLCTRLAWAEQQPAIDAAVAGFPKAFGLRAFPGHTFRINANSSFYSDDTGVQLVVQRLATTDAEDVRRWLKAGDWYDFSRGTESELHRELVRLAPAPAAKGGNVQRTEAEQFELDNATQCGRCGALGHITSLCRAQQGGK